MVVFILPKIILLLKMLFGGIGEKRVNSWENSENGKTSDEPEESKAIDAEYCDDEDVPIHEESDEPVAAPEPRRPAILNGTNLTTQEYIDMLHKIMIPLCSPKENINKDVDLLRPNMSTALIKVLNYVSLRSNSSESFSFSWIHDHFYVFLLFVNKKREICLNSNKLQIEGPQMDIKLKTDDLNKMEIRPIHRKVIVFGPMLKKVMELPFLFNFVIRGKGESLNLKHLTVLHKFQRSFRFCTISRMDLDMDTVHWQGIIDIIKEFTVKVGNFTAVVPKELHSNLLSLSMKMLKFRGTVDVDLLQNINCDNLTLLDSEYQIPDIELLLQLWMRKKLNINTLKMVTIFDKEDLMNFFRTTYAVISEDEATLSDERPLIVKSEEDDNVGNYWLLNENNTLHEMVFFFDARQMTFLSKPEGFFHESLGIPNCLANFL